MKKALTSIMISLLAALVLPTAAFAHVVVKPDTVGVGAFQTYTVSVPNEKEVTVTGIRLTLPANLGEVTPTVKPGWQIDTKKTGQGENASVSEISWTGGEIPVGMRDDFSFSAQAPEKATTLQWKAYQTYADGSVVSWDQTPSGTHDDEAGDKGPFSTTKVINDLSSSPVSAKSQSQAGPYVVAIVAFAVACVALVSSRKRS